MIVCTIMAPNGRTREIKLAQFETLDRVIGSSRGGMHNVDFYAPGVVTTADRVGRCLAVYADREPDPAALMAMNALIARGAL